MQRFLISTFGCQMNVYDEIRLKSLFEDIDMKETDNVSKADVVIINTCSIREKAAEKVFSKIGRMKVAIKKSGRDIKDVVFAVIGCLAKQEGANVFRRVPEVSIVLSSRQYHKLPELVEKARMELLENGKARLMDVDLDGLEKFDELPTVQSSKFSAFIAVQEGCDKFCSYCVVPHTRGKEESRSVESVMKEAINLNELGVVEINLLGQNVDAYHGLGKDGEEKNLAYLVRKISELPNVKRIRYTTSYPNQLGDEMIALHGSDEKLMPFIYLPIQSGSDRILNSMRRRYSVKQYFDVVKKLKDVKPDIQISSDFIVGFPGETDEDFEKTLEVVRQVKYINSYCFKYSPRPNTDAAVMENQIDDSVKSKRLKKLQVELEKYQLEFNESCKGKVMKVLFEKKGKFTGTWMGKTEYMQNVLVNSDEKLEGKILSVKIEVAGKILKGVLNDQD